MNKQQIKELALANGFKLKEQPDGTLDLNPYVYKFAHALDFHANQKYTEKENKLAEQLAQMKDDQCHKCLQRTIVRTGAGDADHGSTNLSNLLCLD